MKIINRHTKEKSILFLLIIALAFMLNIPALSASPRYYYQFEGQGYGGLSGSGTNCFFMVEYDEYTGEKTGNVLYAYCADKGVLLQQNVKYYISGLAPNPIKAILINSVPALKRAQITDNVNASWVAEQLGALDRVLTTAEAVSGSQYAIWHYTDGFNEEISNSYANRLYQYLLSLPEEPHTEYDDVDIRVTSAALDEDGNLNVSFQLHEICSTRLPCRRISKVLKSITAMVQALCSYRLRPLAKR